MSDNEKRLNELLETDTALREVVCEADTPEEAYTAASAAVAGLTREEFVQWVQEIAPQPNDLSEQQLEMATGGKVELTWVSFKPWMRNVVAWESAFYVY